MWKKKDKIQELPTQHNQDHRPEVEEILKAVAQAWLSRHEPDNSTSDSYSNEFDARRRKFLGKPTRFRIEALRRKNKGEENGSNDSNWNFNQSLWDPYEIVAVSKRLEQGLVLENGLSGLLLEEEKKGVLGIAKRKESKNSLRNLFNKLRTRN
ncbi:hypothetical protein V2J09_015021 [Rumex salicifolius]